MATWTTQQVEALAPDASSVKSGRDLANARKWKSLGSNERAAWGECQGSGKDPYQAQVDLSGPTFRCSCPSRKFPCKHGLGLMLLFAQGAVPGEQTPPSWVSDWLSSRAEKAEKQAEKAAQKAEKAAQPVDPAAQAKRAAQRQARVVAGLDYVETWLKDLVRAGMGSLASQGYGVWETPAARMVDAQAPGVARMIREMGSISGDHWQERLLERLARLHLLIEGFRRLETLSPETQADLRALVGWTVSQEELFADPPPERVVRDHWLVAGQRVEEEERLKVQRTWLVGQRTGRPALILSFSAAGQPLDRSLVPGGLVSAELVYFPGAAPLRALVRARDEGAAASAPPVGKPIQTGVAEYGATVAAYPWLEEFPLALPPVTTLHQNGRWSIRDEAGDCLPLSPRFALGWRLLALSGGHAVPLFGEWDGSHLMPLSAWIDGQFHPLAVQEGQG